MEEIANIEPELLESLSDSFEAVPNAYLGEISWEAGIGGRLRPDAILDAVVAGREIAFVVETRGDVFPRDAREIVWHLKRYLQELDNSNRRYVPMILAQSVSEGARDFLQEEQVAYHDLSGSLFVSVDETFVLIERPKPKRAKRRAMNVFKGTRAQVLHALFDRPGEWVSGSEIAEYAGVSAATVSETFKDLERRDWLDVRGEGPAKRRRLIRPDVLLDAWRDSILAGRAKKRSRYYVPRMKPEDMAHEIFSANYYDDYDLEFTGQFAAQFYTPYLSNVSDLTVRTFGKRTHDWLISNLGAREVSEGANLVVIDGKANRNRHWKRDENERLMASPLQVYLDLLEDRGRSKEMAEHLRSQKLVWR
ncbi:type IV toxin-antitoxin system AbiEi family antitoxin [Ruegeria sp. YS9]|uniref:type IV toxin-antitoxin system AbiEi family antitoxin n=1 Tax=Ruegeria sp. YS9 TaxID=2966453 RepID=UPI00214C557B|nr:type IV toxin-antitoxin system AbiEi family antitoxin [Ruegeria sp. YS9]UUV08744.1 type IV toxin-antitoxin system AbiEi family antitoxin [Ruegeria sp. YS9]